MRIRTFLIISAVLAAIYAVTSLVLDNEQLLERPFRLFGGVSMETRWVLILAFAAGVSLTTLALGLREWGLLIERWRMRRTTRQTEEIEGEFSRGLTAVHEGREEKALRHFRAVLEMNSRHFNTLISLGDLMRSQGRFPEAIEFHRKAHHLDPSDTRPLYALVDDHEAAGDADRARSVLDKIIGLDRGSVGAWRKLRYLHQTNGNWEQALEAHARVVKLDRNGNLADRRWGLGIRYELALARLDEGKTREAISGLRQILKEDDGFIPAHVGLGHAQRKAGQDGEAVRTWQNGFEITGSPVFLTRLEEHFLEAEQPLAAIEALKRCIAQARKGVLPRFHLGKLYFRLEMLDDAFAVLGSLEGRASYAPTLHYLIGRIHERRGHHEDAAESYRKVIREMDLVQLDYVCRGCAESRLDWSARCPACGEWNTVEVNFREQIPLDELGIAPAPIYTSEQD